MPDIAVYWGLSVVLALFVGAAGGIIPGTLLASSSPGHPLSRCNVTEGLDERA